MKRSEHLRRRLGVLCLVGLLAVAAPPAGLALAEGPAAGGPGGGAGRLEHTLDALSEALQRLETELDALDNPRLDGLEERIEEAVEAVEHLLDILETPRQELTEAQWRARLVEIDLQLHRLLYVLEEVVESSVAFDGDERPDADEAIEDFREKLEGWIVYASAGMSPEEYEQLESAVYRTAHVLGRRIADIAGKVQPKTTLPGLARLVERLEELLFHLDGFLLQNAPRRG